MYFCRSCLTARSSSDPFVWGERLLEHYRKNRVDSRAKTLFSGFVDVPARH